MIKATLSAWATSLGKEPRTLERMLVKAGVKKPAPRQPLTAHEIFRALLDEEEVLKRRLMSAQAAKIERENAEADGLTARWSEIEKALSEKVIVPLRQLLMAAPAQLDTRCNPDNPELARATITAWRDDALKQLREKLG